MKPEETYYANEFASLAGVTRRTLHYYDEAGLLKPSLYTDANHRLYQREDLLRLQQILTLKRMGFSLAEIRRLLSSPAYDVRQSLRIQKEAIEQQIKQLRQAARALEQTLAALESSEPREWDWEQVIHIIQGVALEDTRRWVERYYTAEQMVRLEERAKGISREQMEQWQQEWSDLIAAFKAKRNLPPGHAEVQALAAEYARLVNLFTEGDSGIEASLKRMYQDFDQMPSEYRMYDAELGQFMAAACGIYKERNHQA